MFVAVYRLDEHFGFDHLFFVCSIGRASKVAHRKSKVPRKKFVHPSKSFFFSGDVFWTVKRLTSSFSKKYLRYLTAGCWIWICILKWTEADVRTCFSKKMFLKISQYLQGNTCVESLFFLQLYSKVALLCNKNYPTFYYLPDFVIPLAPVSNSKMLSRL